MEIKFRVWNKYEKKFINTLLIDQKGDIKEYNGSYLSDNDDENNNIQFFTGLKDRKGKEIFEGDILKGKDDDYINGFLSPVEFYSGSFHVTLLYDLNMLPLSGFKTVWLNNGCKGNTETSLWIDDFEIIGNIYENSNLLKD